LFWQSLAVPSFAKRGEDQRPASRLVVLGLDVVHVHVVLGQREIAAQHVLEDVLIGDPFGDDRKARHGAPSKVLRQPAQVPTHEGLGETHRALSGQRLRRAHPADTRRSVLSALRHEQALLVVAEVQPVEHRGVVRGEKYLLLVLPREHHELRDERGDELRVERGVDVVDREE